MALLSRRRLQLGDQSDYERAIEATLTKLLRKSDKQWLRLVEPNGTFIRLFYADHCYVVEESFLVYYEVGVPWYATDRVLSEQLVLRLRPGADFDCVPRFLEQEALRHGCRLVIAGTAFAVSDGALTRMYGRRGFRPEATTLVKETDPDGWYLRRGQQGST